MLPPVQSLLPQPTRRSGTHQHRSYKRVSGRDRTAGKPRRRCRLIRIASASNNNVTADAMTFSSFYTHRGGTPGASALIGCGFCRRRHAIIISADTTPSLALTRRAAVIQGSCATITWERLSDCATPMRLARRREWCVGANTHEVWASGKHNYVVGEQI